MDDWRRWIGELADFGLVPLIVAALWVLSRVKSALEERWNEPGTGAQATADDKTGRLRGRAASDYRPIVPR